jgi:hypothetical protein
MQYSVFGKPKRRTHGTARQRARDLYTTLCSVRTLRLNEGEGGLKISRTAHIEREANGYQNGGLRHKILVCLSYKTKQVQEVGAKRIAYSRARAIKIPLTFLLNPS